MGQRYDSVRDAKGTVMVRVRFAWLLGMWAMAAGLGPAADWPEFRGPTGQGLSLAKNVPTKWGPAENVVWKQEVAGQGWSSPILVEGKLYLTAAVPLASGEGDFSLVAQALDATSGKILWTVEVFRRDGMNSEEIHRKNSHASPTPLYADGKLFVHFGPQGTACLDLKGQIVWKSTEFAFTTVHGNGGSPILAGNALVFHCDGASEPFVVALDRATGATLWKTPRPDRPRNRFAFATPLLIEVDGTEQIISPGAQIVMALNPRTGEEIWHVDYDGYSVIPRPVFGHGLVIMSTGYNQPSLLAIRPTGQGDVTEANVAWSLKRGAPHTPSPLLVGNELYVVSDRGIATCLDAKTGEQHWQERLTGEFSASPLFADGNVYFQNETGSTFVVRASKTYELVQRNEVDERTLASPIVDDGTLYLRTATKLYRFGTR